jgi:hypothetical protein
MIFLINEVGNVTLKTHNSFKTLKTDDNQLLQNLAHVYKSKNTHIPEISNLQLLKILKTRTLIHGLCIDLKHDNFFVKPNIPQHLCQQIIIS